jgi:ADP-ribose pyrophosphatase YjhB (NUDIX family)
LVKDGRILLFRRFNTRYEDGNYSVPAGHIDGNERATDAMLREAKEEARVMISEGDIRMVHVMHRMTRGKHHHENDERIDFFFGATRWEGEPQRTWRLISAMIYGGFPSIIPLKTLFHM